MNTSEAGNTAWRNFSHVALVDAVSADLAEAGWVNDPAILCEEPSAHVQFAGNALLRSLFKKWRSESVSAESRALLTFLEANHLSRGWTLPPEFAWTERFHTVWSRFKWELDKFLHPGGNPLVTSYRDIFDVGYTGPGASLGASGQSFYAKFGSSLLTSTSVDLYELYSGYAGQYPTWRAAESCRKLRHGDVRVTDMSSVSFAPKNADTARLICTEPSINMFAQLGLKSLFDKRLMKEWGVDMEDQPEINRFLARIGSRTGEYCTLDLSSASDRISTELCRQALPEWLYQLLLELRCATTSVKDYDLCVDLGMISTMGNGFTFPLMTILLSCAVRAVYHDLGLPIQDNVRRMVDGNWFNVHANWAVFGDDLVVRREAYDDVVSFLQLLGLEVNLAKSFKNGPFRESCGHDYFHGLNVRGVYLRKMTSLQDVAVAVNLLNNWSSETGICLKRGVRYLMSLYRDNKVFYVPYAMPLDSGIRVPRLLIPSGTPLTRKGERWAYKTCFRAWTERSAKVKFGDGIVMVPSGSRRLGYNANALLLSLLIGEVRDGQISIRQNMASLYHTQWHVTPNWDYVPPSYWFNHRRDWLRFEAAVYENLFS